MVRRVSDVAAVKVKYRPRPLQDFRRLHCEGCGERLECNDVKMLGCIAAADLRDRAWARQQREVRGY